MFTFDPQTNTSINESRDCRSFLLGCPLGDQDVHGRKGQPSSQPHQDPHQDQVRISGHGTHRAEEGADDVDDDGREEDPFAAVHFSQPAPGYLSEEVTPKVGAQDETLLSLRPEKGSVLVLRKLF